MARLGRYWRDREKKLMRSLGLKPTFASGAGWLEKEDGESERLIAQLKSTEAKSISVKLQDVKDLVYHARISHKLPVFVIDFVGEFTLLCIRPEDLQGVASAIESADESEDV